MNIVTLSTVDGTIHISASHIVSVMAVKTILYVMTVGGELSLRMGSEGEATLGAEKVYSAMVRYNAL